MDDQKREALKKMLGQTTNEIDSKLIGGGQYADTQRKIESPGERLDSYTGAPARTAIGEMQKGNFGFDMLKKTWNQVGQDPQKAPTGEQLVRNTGVENDAVAKTLGAGLDMAADASGVAGMARKAAVPLAGAVKSISNVDQFNNVKRMFQVGDTKFPAGSTAEAMKVKEALEKAGRLAPGKTLTVLD